MRSYIPPIIYFLAICFSMSLDAQLWKEVGDPYSTREVYQAKAHQGKLWLLDDGDAFTGTKATSLRLKTWDNSSWNTYPVYTPTGIDSIHGQEFLGVDTSVYVSYLSFFNGFSKAGLLRFDILSESWKEISSVNDKLDYGSEIRAMAFYDNDLYLGGILLNSSGDNQLMRVKHPVAFGEVFGKVTGSINYFANYQGSLYFGGVFDSIGSLAIENLAIFSNNVFTAYSGVGKTVFLKSFPQGELVFQEERNPQLKFLNSISAGGDEVLNADFPADFTIRDLDNRSGERFCIQYSAAALYPAAVYHLNNKKNIWESMQSKLDPLRSVFVQTGKMLYLVELSGNSYHIEKNGMAYLSAQVFVDIDGDCAKTAGDRLLDQGLIIEDLNSGQHWYANESGFFEDYVGDGTYKLTLPNIPNRLSNTICGPLKIIQLNSGDSVNVNIPLSIKDTASAVRVSITSPLGFRARQGFEEEYILHVYNEGFRYQNCQLNLQMPDEIQFTEASVWPIDSNGTGRFTWNMNIAPFQSFEIRFKGSVELSTPSYTKVKMDAWSDAACLNQDNLDSLVLKVVGAFDPNDKQNFPEGVINHSTSEIIYHIRFQNTGTDTAVRVTVIDTLDLHLPLTYIKLMAVSHPFTLKLSGASQKFIFDDISLPDSSVDFEGSQGYITYKAGLKPNIRHGDSIVNTAYIYFDYQDAVVTNTVNNEIILEEDAIPIVGLNDLYLVYPNPSRGHFQIVNFTSEASSCELYDTRGRLIGKWKLPADNELNMDLSLLSPGVYFIKFPEWHTQESVVITR